MPAGERNVVFGGDSYTGLKDMPELRERGKDEDSKKVQTQMHRNLKGAGATPAARAGAAQSGPSA